MTPADRPATGSAIDDLTIPSGLADPTRPIGGPFPPGGRVAAVRLDGMGDVLLTGPAVRAIAARADHLSFVCGPRGEAAARLLPGVDEVVVFDAPWIELDVPPIEAPVVEAQIGRLRQAALDAAVVFTSDHQSSLPTALALKLAGVGRVAGISADHPGGLLDLRVRAISGHQVERNLLLALAAGYGGDGDRALRVQLPERSMPAVPSGSVVLHVGASVPARSIPTDVASELIEELVDEGRTVFLTGSTSETAPLQASVGKPLAHRRSSRRQVIDLGGRLDLAELAHLIASCAVLVSGNTGPAHLAAAVGTPIVSVFAPVVPRSQWLPWSTRVVVLGEDDIACAGCRARRCPFPGQPCLAGVDGSALARAVHRSLELVPTPFSGLRRRVDDEVTA